MRRVMRMSAWMGGGGDGGSDGGGEDGWRIGRIVM